MLAGSSERIPVTLQGGRGSKTYEVIVHTHEDAGSSTTSDVCIRMIGADGHSTPEIELPAQEGDFSRGRPPARFRLDNVDDVGELRYGESHAFGSYLSSNGRLSDFACRSLEDCRGWLRPDDTPDAPMDPILHIFFSANWW